MSLARRHRDRILAAQTAASALHGGAVAAPAAVSPPAAGADNTRTASPADIAARQIALRLTHDLRQLKETRSIDNKIAAKRKMLPEYRSWILGLLEADRGVGTGVAAEVAPTVMVWLIDTGDFDGALVLGEFLLRHRVEMPGRYQRDTATVIAEEIADAALRRFNANEAFPIEFLDRTATLVDGIDLHDEVRAKLHKATGVVQLDMAELLPAEESRAGLAAALLSLTEAQRLNPRAGVKDRIKRATKLLAAVTPPTEQGAPDQNGAAA